MSINIIFIILSAYIILIMFYNSETTRLRFDLGTSKFEQNPSAE